jgi:hypothetical protein
VKNVYRGVLKFFTQYTILLTQVFSDLIIKSLKGEIMFYRSNNAVNSLILGGVSVLGFVNFANINFTDPFVFGFGLASFSFVAMYIASLHTKINDLKADIRSDRDYYTLEEVKKELSERLTSIEKSSK